MADFINDAPLDRKKEKIRIKIKREERDYFSKLFDAAKPKGSSKLSGNDAVAFFRKSRLPPEMLKKIWLLSAQTNPAFIDRDEFYVALRLVALAQAKREVSLSSIINNVDAPLPFFESFAMPQTAVSSTIMPPMMMSSMSSLPAQSNPYSITPEEIAKYSRICDSADTSRSGKITAEQMTELLTRTKLPEAVLGQVWELAETDEEGSFDKVNVIIVLHLLIKYKTGVQLPPMIPAGLKAMVQAYLKGGDMPQPKAAPMMNPPPAPMPSKPPADPNDPFAEIEPAQSFGGVAPLYGYPQLPAPVYPTAPIEEAKFPPTPSYPEIPQQMSPTPERIESGRSSIQSQGQLKELLVELQNLNNEKAYIKNSIATQKVALTREENMLNSQIVALRDIAIEYAELAKALTNTERGPKSATNNFRFRDDPYPSSDKASTKTGATFGGNGGGFSWDTGVDGKVGNGGNFDEQAFDFS